MSKRSLGAFSRSFKRSTGCNSTLSDHYSAPDGDESRTKGGFCGITPQDQVHLRTQSGQFASFESDLHILQISKSGKSKVPFWKIPNSGVFREGSASGPLHFQMAFQSTSKNLAIRQENRWYPLKMAHLA